MVLPRRLRGDKENFNSSANRQSRPWDNDISRLKPAVPVSQVSVTDRLRQFESTAYPKSIRVPPPARASNPLNAFLDPTSEAASSPPASPPPQPLQLPTRIGNREVKPLLSSPPPPPLVGLPIPMSPASPRPRSTSSKPIPQSSSKAAQIASQVPLPPPPPPPLPPPMPMSAVTPGDSLPSMGPEDSRLDRFDSPNSTFTSRRYSVRQPSVRQSVRHSMRVPSQDCNRVKSTDRATPSGSIGGDRQIMQLPPAPPLPSAHPLDLLPDSSSFLDFNDDHRLAPLDPQGVPPLPVPSVHDNSSFPDEDGDSFDTFESLPTRTEANMANAINPPVAGEGLERTSTPSVHVASHSGSQKTMFPNLSFTAPSLRTEHDEEDGGLDVPDDFATSPAASRAMRDLQRASITAAHELAQSIRLMHEEGGINVDHSPRGPVHPEPTSKDASAAGDAAAPSQGDGNKLQGQLLLRSRLFRRWNLRYVTVIQQAYFGPVLLLFRPDSKPIFHSAFSLKSSKMVALAHAKVSMQEAPKKHNGSVIHLFDLTTSHRTYTFACMDPESRTRWVSNLSTFMSR